MAWQGSPRPFPAGLGDSDFHKEASGFFPLVKSPDQFLDPGCPPGASLYLPLTVTGHNRESPLVSLSMVVLPRVPVGISREQRMVKGKNMGKPENPRLSAQPLSWEARCLLSFLLQPFLHSASIHSLITCKTFGQVWSTKLSAGAQSPVG